MVIGPGSVALDRFQVVAPSGIVGGAQVFLAQDAAAGGAPAWLLVLELGAVPKSPPAAVMERVQRHALSAGGLRRPLALGMLGETQVAIGYPAGTSLAQVVATGESFDGPRLAKVVRAVTRAIAVLHNQGIAHGHVRTDLIAETNDGASVAGYGVAAVLELLSGSAAAASALPVAYRAPELQSGARIETWSDVYALGVVVSEALAGRFVSAGEVISPRALGAEVSDRVEALVSAALNATPSARPADVRVWGETLVEALNERASVTARRAAVVEVSDSVQSAATSGHELAARPPETTETHAELSVDTSVAIQGADSAQQAGVAPQQPSGAASGPTPPHHDVRPAARSRVLPLAVLAVIGGILLMLGGLSAVIVYAKRYAPAPVATALKSPPPVKAPAPTARPRPTTPSPTQAELEESRGAPESLGLTPLKPPSAANATFEADARASLPVTPVEPAWGTKSAPVTIVLFGDLECVHTRRLVRVLERIKSSFGDDVRWVFRHRPLRNHTHAAAAARVFAGISGSLGHHMFFKALHELAQNETPPTFAELRLLMKRAGIDVNPETLAEQAATASAVAADVELGARFDVRGTPTMFVNGIRVDGFLAYERLKPLVLTERRAAIWALASGTPPESLYTQRVQSNLIGGGDNEAQVERHCVPLDGAPSIGPATALVTVVEFSDFECPHCKYAVSVLQKLRARHPDQLRLVWKSFPLPQHPRALPALNFALEARKQGGDAAFFRVHDLLFEAQAHLDNATLETVATRAGLRAEELLRAANTSVHAKAIDADVKLGRELGVAGAPTFFINGRLLSGARPLAEFDALIREELAAAQRMVARGLPADRIYDFTCDQAK